MSRTRLLLVLAVTVVLLVVGVVGWRTLAPDRTYASGSALADQCDDVPSDAERVVVTGSDGVRLGGALVGPAGAELGVVLRQGAGQTICQWLPWAERLSEETGAVVLLFDRRGFGASPGQPDVGAEPDDLTAAVELLRGGGTAQVALVGSSMGNAVMFTALDRLDLAPCAVASISPVLTFTDTAGSSVDGTALRRVPANTWITWETRNPGIGAEVDLIRAGVRGGLPASHLLGVDTSDHSIRLVDRHQEVPAFLVAAVESCTVATP